MEYKSYRFNNLYQEAEKDIIDDLKNEIDYLKKKMKQYKYREEELEEELRDLDHKKEKLEMDIQKIVKEKEVLKVIWRNKT